MKWAIRITRFLAVAAIVVLVVAFAGWRLLPRRGGPVLAEQELCGYVASATFASRTRGTPTFLNLGKPYPDQEATIVIWGTDRERFPEPPEVVYLHQRICARGPFQNYQGKPEISVRDPSQIRPQ